MYLSNVPISLFLAQPKYSLTHPSTHQPPTPHSPAVDTPLQLPGQLKPMATAASGSNTTSQSKYTRNPLPSLFRCKKKEGWLVGGGAYNRKMPPAPMFSRYILTLCNSGRNIYTIFHPNSQPTIHPTLKQTPPKKNDDKMEKRTLTRFCWENENFSTTQKLTHHPPPTSSTKNPLLICVCALEFSTNTPNTKPRRCTFWSAFSHLLCAERGFTIEKLNKKASYGVCVIIILKEATKWLKAPPHSKQNQTSSIWWWKYMWFYLLIPTSKRNLHWKTFSFESAHIESSQLVRKIEQI